MQDVILSVQDLEVEFTLRGKTLHAIRGISLDICEGEPCHRGGIRQR